MQNFYRFKRISLRIPNSNFVSRGSKPIFGKHPRTTSETSWSVMDKRYKLKHHGTPDEETPPEFQLKDLIS